MKNRYNNIFYFHTGPTPTTGIDKVAKITPSLLADRCSSIESHAGKTRDTYDSSDEEADFVDTPTTMTPSVLERRLATMRLRRCTMSTQFNDWSHVLETYPVAQVSVSRQDRLLNRGAESRSTPHRQTIDPTSRVARLYNRRPRSLKCDLN